MFLTSSFIDQVFIPTTASQRDIWCIQFTHSGRSGYITNSPSGAE
jgi:hypothetical protein